MKPFRILIVDDDETWSGTLKENLATPVSVRELAGSEYEGVRIEIATNQADAEKAIAAAELSGYDLVLLDLRYPMIPNGPLEEDDDGPFQGMKWLPELRRLQPATTIVILTSYAGQAHLKYVVQAIRDHSANDFIPKTAPFQNILARIGVACGNSQRVQQLLLLEEEWRSLLRTRAARTYSEDVAELLNKVRGSLYSIAMRIEKQRTAEGTETAQAIRGEVDYLNYEFDRLTALLNKGHERRRAVDIAAQVRQLISLYRRHIEKAHAKAEVPSESESLLLTTFEGDVRVALHEVLNNALFWLERSSTPAQSRRLIVTVEPVADGAIITVADNGDGFSDVSRLFERGYSTSDDEAHRGLGLYIARRMMQEIGGDISARNREEDQGGAEVKLFVRNLGQA